MSDLESDARTLLAIGIILWLLATVCVIVIVIVALVLLATRA
jgi:hypothetical protein